MITMSFGVLALMLGVTASVSGLIGLVVGCCARAASDKKGGKTCRR